jgi:alanyl-tRNA synthetase
MGDVHDRQKEIAQLRRQLAHLEFEALLQHVQRVEGVQVLAARVEATRVETLREMSDWFRNRLGSVVIVLGAVIDDRPSFVSAVTPDLVERGVRAGNLIKEVARVVGGGGGGRPTMAQAGGRDPNRLDEALNLVPKVVVDMLTSGR